MPQQVTYTTIQEQPIHLCAEKSANPKAVIKEFFESYYLPHIREHLWDFITGLMNSQEADNYTGIERMNAMTFYRDLEILIEAVWLQQQKKKTKKAKEN